MSSPSRLPLPETLSSVLILILLAVAALLWTLAPEFYYRISQEDGPLEWATFWAFLLAALLAFGAIPGRPSGGAPWRTLYLAAFGIGCLAVAAEEISWGQRLFTYRPPELFLADNFQQELNLHNLADTSTRKAMLTGLLIGFGVLFPLLGQVPSVAHWFRQQEVPAPAPAIIPGFVALALLYLAYPMESTGEWVEAGTGLGFLLPAVGYLGRLRTAWLPAVGSLPILLGILTPPLLAGTPDPTKIDLAMVEASALAQDVKARRLRSRCGVHKRLYTFVEEFGSGDLSRGAWGQLEDTDDETSARRQYFLDPWNLPYWIRHACRDGRPTAIYVYSFGPNRRRDSSARGIQPDDVGSYASRP